MATRPTSMHLRSADGKTTRCGKEYRAEILTDTRDEVTCRSCRRTWEVNGPRRATGNERKARNSATYADSTFAGLGILRCHICGRPCRDHGRTESCR